MYEFHKLEWGRLKNMVWIKMHYGVCLHSRNQNKYKYTNLIYTNRTGLIYIIQVFEKIAEFFKSHEFYNKRLDSNFVLNK